MLGQIEDQAIRKWLKWSILGAGRTARDVSLSLGYPPDYLTDELASRHRLGKEFIAKVLGELGYSLGDFFTCVEGRLGDPRLQLGRILATAEAPPVWPSKFPAVKRRKSPKKPPVDIWELSAKRFEISLKRASSYAGWYAIFGETQAIRCEGWGALGAAQREKGALRHAAYCFLQAITLCQEASEQQAIIQRRVAHLLLDVGDFQLFRTCLGKVLGMFALHGNMECVGQVLVDMSLADIHLGKFTSALRAAVQAPRYTSDPRHLFAAHHGAGHCYLQLDQIAHARRMAEYCLRNFESDREIFYAEYLYALCLVELQEWKKAMEALQRAANVASYDGIFLGDQLELELVNIRCHLEMKSLREAKWGIDRFRKIALLVSSKFANAYTTELHELIRRRDVHALLQLQASLTAQFRKTCHPSRSAE